MDGILSLKILLNIETKNNVGDKLNEFIYVTFLLFLISENKFKPTDTNTSVTFCRASELFTTVEDRNDECQTTDMRRNLTHPLYLNIFFLSNRCTNYYYNYCDLLWCLLFFRSLRIYFDSYLYCILLYIYYIVYVIINYHLS